ncbi:hypothetical protein, partial [Escherichia coli]|uniref:hypothetical protein n=1 Tax=Escherichia coli TaxID=562 RepID=UPI001BAEBE86
FIFNEISWFLKGFIVESNRVVSFTKINQLRSGFGECFLRLFVKACYALPQLITVSPALPTFKSREGSKHQLRLIY